MPPSGSPLKLSRDRLIETTLDLVSFDTSNPPGDTREIVTWLESAFQEFGLDTERFATDQTKPNLLASLPGERPTTLLYSGHLDTVPYDRDGWSFDPLGEQVDNLIYGRGTTDMKGAIAAMVELARAYAESETVPPVTLGFAFVSDEEIAGGAGVKALLEAEKLDADGCVIGEPTCTRNAHSVTVADKGSIWLTLEATGEAAHGSRPMLGENAIDRLWAALDSIRTRLASYPVSSPEALGPVIEESIGYYSTSMDESDARQLFEQPTVNLGTIEGGDAVNSIPRHAAAQVDIRLPPGVQTETVLEDIRAWIGACEGVTIADVNWSVGTYEPPDSPLVEATMTAAREVIGQRIHRRSATGGGDAKQLRDAHIPTVEFAAGTDTLHACDEFTTVDALVRTAEVYARLPELFAQATAGSSETDEEDDSR